MIFNYLAQKDVELNKRFLSKEILKKDEIVEFLDNLIDSAGKLYNKEQLRAIFTLFRKWYNIHVKFYDHSYNKSISRDAVFKVRSKETKQYESVLFVLSKYSFDEQATSDNINKLARIIDPYTCFVADGLREIDPVFYYKYKNLERISNATKLFKKSELDSSKKIYSDVLKSLDNKDELDNTQLFLYAWTLHGLGNIELIRSNFKVALQLYSESINIKNKIEDLSRIYFYSSNAKMIFSGLHIIGIIDWNIELKRFLFSIKDDKDAYEENHLWYMNIVADVTHQLSKSYFYIGNVESSEQYCREGIEVSKDCSDFVGLAKYYVLLGMINKKYCESLHHLTEVIENNFNKDKRSDPYARDIISKNSLSEISIIDEGYAMDIYKLFEKYGIIPLE